MSRRSGYEWIARLLGVVLSLSVQKIEALSPDQSSLAAARKLLKPAGWPVLQSDGAGLIWGECQGSGSTPYRIAVTEMDAGYKCSCPSRKFPCKHALALMWLRADQLAPFAQGTPPQWVTDWLGRRRGPAAASAKPAAANTPVKEQASIAALAAEEEPAADDPKAIARAEAARERNRVQRERLIEEGLESLDRWVKDELDRGLAGFDQRAEQVCGTLAKRLVDAKAGGLATRVEQLPSLLFALDEGERGAAAAQQLGMLVLMAAAWRRQDDLPALLRADLRQAIGWTITRDGLLADAEAIRADGRWMVMAIIDEVQPDRLRRLETWLARLDDGQGPRHAALIDYVPVSVGPAGAGFSPGEVIEAELAFYPSPVLLRAQIAAQRSSEAEGAAWPAPDSDLPTAFAAWHTALARKPWLGDWPMAVGNVTIRSAAGRLYATGGDLALPLASSAVDGAVPLCDAGAMALYGLWDGQVLKPTFAETTSGRWIAA